jgi:hypothetical protein
MSFKDKIFCMSPNCKNKCHRRITVDVLRELQNRPVCDRTISTAYFCDIPEETIMKRLMCLLFGHKLTENYIFKYVDGTTDYRSDNKFQYCDRCHRHVRKL